MKEQPILFSAPMIRALLDGSKTQTRRMVKFKPPFDRPGSWPFVVKYKDRWEWAFTDWQPNEKDLLRLMERPGRTCPHGEPGDRLWVKETFRLWSHSFESVGVEYAAGGEDKIVDFPDKVGMPTIEKICIKRINGVRSNRPSIFMPRWASRITLEITDVRVERLQDISQEDASDEGVIGVNTGDFVTAYATLWESINGKGSWDKNPWVWAISFRRIQNG